MTDKTMKPSAKIAFNHFASWIKGKKPLCSKVFEHTIIATSIFTMRVSLVWQEARPVKNGYVLFECSQNTITSMGYGKVEEDRLSERALEDGKTFSRAEIEEKFRIFESLQAQHKDSGAGVSHSILATDLHKTSVAFKPFQLKR